MLFISVSFNYLPTHLFHWFYSSGESSLIEELSKEEYIVKRKPDNELDL